MKTLKAALIAGLALASVLAAKAESSAQAWLENYYTNPQPDRLAEAVTELSQTGYFEQEGHVPLAIGFLSTVFQQNPARVDNWLSALQDLPARHQRLLAAALWQAGDRRGSDMLVELSDDSAVRVQVRHLAITPGQTVANTPVLSTSSMNLQWGSFLASGSDKPVIAILAAMGEHPNLSGAARVALAENAAAHPRVMEICRAQLDRQPESVRAEVRAALNQAAAGKPGV